MTFAIRSPFHATATFTSFGAARRSFNVPRPLPSLVLRAGLLLCMACSLSCAAQDTPSCVSEGHVSLAYGSVPARAATEQWSFSTTLRSAEPVRELGSAQGHLGTTFESSVTLKAGRPTPEPSFVLVRRKIRSRHAYDALAKLDAGYGQFFAKDSTDRSRMDGVPIDDPDWFYLKMNFSF
jgi:hypothetical protein